MYCWYGVEYMFQKYLKITSLLRYRLVYLSTGKKLEVVHVDTSLLFSPVEIAFITDNTNIC